MFATLGDRLILMSKKLGPFELNRVYCIDCIEGMRKLPPNSIGAIITDPPYGLEFMGKEWDRFKKAGHWNGNRGKQEHKDAYGRIQGKCPSSYRTKRLTNPQGAYEHKKGFWVLPRFFGEDNDTYQKWTLKWASEVLRVLKPGGYLLALGGTRTYHRMACGIEDAGFRIRDCLVWGYASGFPKSFNISKGFDKMAGKQGRILKTSPASWGKSSADQSWGMPGRTHKFVEPATALARKWYGWGTGLKPSWQPIIMAQKPIERNFCYNIEKWGVGGINVEGCRIPFENRNDLPKGGYGNEIIGFGSPIRKGTKWMPTPAMGRFPANTIRTDKFGDCYDKFFMIPKPSRKEKDMGCDFLPKQVNFRRLEGLQCQRCGKRKHSGSPCQCKKPEFEKSMNTLVKVSNHHPTVKPVRLMEHLIRLFTPKGEIVLDPFAGSGTTGVASIKLGMNFLLFEKVADYCNISRSRIKA